MLKYRIQLENGAWQEVISEPANGNYEIVNESTPNALKETVLSLYAKHRERGQVFYNEFRGLIVVRVLQGAITEAKAIEVSDFLKTSFEWIEKGDWKNARAELNSLTSSDQVLIDYKNEVYIIVDNYITANFTM